MNMVRSYGALTRSPSDAEAATQEIFLDIWRSGGRYDATQGSVKVFIAMIARRRLIDRLRKTTSEPPMDPVDILDTVAWSDPGTASEIRARARAGARRSWLGTAGGRVQSSARLRSLSDGGVHW